MNRAISLVVTSGKIRRPKSDRIGQRIQELLYSWGFDVYGNEVWENGLFVGGLTFSSLDPRLIQSIRDILESEGLRVDDRPYDPEEGPLKRRANISVDITEVP